MRNTWWLAGRMAVIALGMVAVFQPVCASPRHQSKPAVPHQTRVTYQADGTPIATGAPRRLSALAMGGSAWMTLHETRARKHRQQVATKQ